MSCEDWPCCGHDTGCCPDFDPETGEQLALRGTELEMVKDALEHPPAKLNFIATAASAASALLVMFKAASDMVDDAKFSAGLLVFFAVGLSLAVTITVLYIVTITRKNPFHDRAMIYVDRLIAQQAESGAAPPITPVAAALPSKGAPAPTA